MCECICVEGGSVASQIEIDGQDDGEKKDGSEDEDQDTILDDPADRHRQREKENKKGFTVKQSHVYVQTK